jgi:hypothetical protein
MQSLRDIDLPFCCSTPELEEVVLEFVPDYQALFKFLFGWDPGELHNKGSPGALSSKGERWVGPGQQPWVGPDQQHTHSHEGHAVG